MADCPRCGPNVGLAAQATPEGPIFLCAKCQKPIFGPGEEQAPAPVAAQKRRAAAPSPLADIAADPAALVREAKRQLKQRRSRIRQLRRELKAEEKAEKQLTRLLDAADGKPLAVVRELKRSSG